MQPRQKTKKHGAIYATKTENTSTGTTGQYVSRKEANTPDVAVRMNEASASWFSSSWLSSSSYASSAIVVVGIVIVIFLSLLLVVLAGWTW